jgi:hypothetical protein
VGQLAGEIADQMIAGKETAEISIHLRGAFLEIARTIQQTERGESVSSDSKAAALARRILETAAGYGLKGGWTGELNYAVTRLIQMVPYRLAKTGTWSEPLRYWIYAETVGALTRTALDLHQECGNDYVGNGLCGVFIDVKDEYKRRVNTAYEAAQITKSGDCYDLVPFRTHLVPAEVGGVRGFQEVMLPQQELD